MSAPYQPRVARKFIGGYRPRIDAVEKAHGRAPYADDMISERNYPGLLYAQVLRSPYPRARIVRLDVSKADATAGGQGHPDLPGPGGGAAQADQRRLDRRRGHREL